MKLNFTSLFSVTLVSDRKYRNKSISRNFSDKSKSNDDNFRGVQAIVHYYQQYLVSKEGSGEDGKIYKKNIKSWRIAHVFFFVFAALYFASQAGSDFQAFILLIQQNRPQYCPQWSLTQYFCCCLHRSQWPRLSARCPPP